MKSAFPGFDPRTIRFLRALKRNNRRPWFEAHRDNYEAWIRTPAKAWVEALREPMARINPNLAVGPRSVGRIYRDTRFSPDKTPYKTYVSFSFDDRRFGKEFTPGCYMGFDPTGIAYGTGIYSFNTIQRELFRARITEGPLAERFTHVVSGLKKGKRFEPRGLALKNIPKGYDPEHPNAEFLKYNGFYVVHEEDLPAAFYSPRILKHAMGILAQTRPLQDWMADFVRSLPPEISGRK
jgi:uncharacterized protein (TIGR02453 family)